MITHLLHYTKHFSFLKLVNWVKQISTDFEVKQRKNEQKLDPDLIFKQHYRVWGFLNSCKSQDSACGILGFTTIQEAPMHRTAPQ